MEDLGFYAPSANTAGFAECDIQCECWGGGSSGQECAKPVDDGD